MWRHRKQPAKEPQQLWDRCGTGRAVPLLSTVPKQPPWQWSCAREKENGKWFWGERRYYCRCLDCCRVLPKRRRRREGERKYLSSFRRSRGWQWKGKCQWDESSVSGISPKLVKVSKCSCSRPSKPWGALHQPGGSGQGRALWLPGGCSQGFGSIVHPQGSVPQAPARTPVSPSRGTQLPPELSPGHGPSPARAGREHGDPSSTGRGMLALLGLARGAACLGLAGWRSA